MPEHVFREAYLLYDLRREYSTGMIFVSDSKRSLYFGPDTYDMLWETGLLGLEKASINALLCWF